MNKQLSPGAIAVAVGVIVIVLVAIGFAVFKPKFGEGPVVKPNLKGGPWAGASHPGAPASAPK